jgi:hypothetical protein
VTNVISLSAARARRAATHRHQAVRLRTLCYACTVKRALLVPIGALIAAGIMLGWAVLILANMLVEAFE